VQFSYKPSARQWKTRLVSLLRCQQRCRVLRHSGKCWFRGWGVDLPVTSQLETLPHHSGGGRVESGLACYDTVGNAALSPRWRGGGACIVRIHHTASFLRLFVPNSLTVHPRSFSLNAVLAVSSVVSAIVSLLPVSRSQNVTSSPFLWLLISSSSMIRREPV
jgi:hypothetical protein